MTDVRTAAAWTENDLLAYVERACRQLGLMFYHTYDSRRSNPGFPDCVIAGPGGVLFAELKSHRGSLSPDQRQWSSALLKAHASWTVWRPSEAIDGTIVNRLIKLAKVPGEPEYVSWGDSRLVTVPEPENPEGM